MRTTGVLVALVLLLAGALAQACVAQAATIDVSTTEDPAGGGACPGSPCSLRQAVAFASSGDTIQLAGKLGSPDVYKLTQGSQIVVSKSLTIVGNGIDESGVNGAENLNGQSELERILKVTGGTLHVEGVTFTGGEDGNDESFQDCGPCETLNANGGGAIFNDGATVTLHEVFFKSDGGGGPAGGAIGNEGTLEMEGVTFSGDNSAYGGGLFSRGGIVDANGATFEEDGLDAFDGGAIFLYEGTDATLTNTTIVDSGWASSFGGGIDNDDSTLRLTNDTLSGNIRGALETDGSGGTTVQNTIIGSGFSDNVDYDCVPAGKENNAGTTTTNAITLDKGNNIDQDGVCGLDATGDHSGVDPKLVPITENGGPVFTQALVHGSAAIEGGNEAACPATDARGVARPQGSVCDIGAFEATLLGQPGAVTEPALAVNFESEELAATIKLAGEAGGFHFLYGVAPGPLTNETPVAPAGVVSGEDFEIAPLTGLSPGTTYCYRAVADNASGSVPASTILSFTTPTEGGEHPAEGTCEQPPKGPEEPAKGGEAPAKGGGEAPKGSGEVPAKGGGEQPPAKTATVTPLPPPVLGETLNVEIVSGKVFVSLPSTGHASFAQPLQAAIDSAALAPAFASASKGLKFIPLSEARQIPVGSTLEATAGVARITTATATLGKTQSGEFGSGIFKLLQPRKQKGLTELDIVNNHTAKQVCATSGKKAAVVAKHLSSKVLGRLNGEAHGNFATHGQYSASTVRGTAWSVANECDGTLTTVARGEVSVFDFHRRKTITLFAGQHYLAFHPHGPLSSATVRG
jgi:hypothetical protein